jgi:regulator of protease activity HflC (stomatin/prohibitin superfamily)
MSQRVNPLVRVVLVLAGVDLLLAGGAGVGGLFAGFRPLLALAAAWLLLGGVLFGTWLAARRAARPPADKPRADVVVEAQWALIALGIAALIPAFLADDPVTEAGAPWVLGALGASVAIAAVQARFLSRSELPWAAGLGAWARWAGWLGAVAAIPLGLQLGLDRAPDTGAWGRGIAVAVAVPVAFAIPQTFRLSRPWKKAPDQHLTQLPAASVGLLVLLFGHANPVRSVLDGLEQRVGVDLKSTWALQVFRRSLEPLAIGLVLAGWLSTCLQPVDTHEVGVRERLGKPSDRVLEPGLHLALPWPIDAVRRVPVGRVHTVVVGHAEDEPEIEAGVLGWLFAEPDVQAEDEEDESRLWAKQHGEEEFTLLLGDGRDLISLDGLVHYRIVDPHAWLYGCQNPEERIEAAAYRALMTNTADKSLEQALSENLQVLADDIRAEMAAQLVDAGIGVEVVAFNLSALHPPVAVAVDYQSVVSAQIDQERLITEAQGYRMGLIPMARTDALVASNRASADASTRLAEARGEAAAFTAVEVSYRASPQLFRFRRRMDVLEVNLENQRLYILDDRFEADGGNVWLME